MSDLIKREDAIKAMEQRYQDILRIFKRKVKDGEKAIVLDMIGCIKSLPSADRPQGEWIEKNNGYDTTCECSVCHYRNFIPNYQVGSKYVCMDRYWFKRNFCPNCGSKMRGEHDD